MNPSIFSDDQITEVTRTLKRENGSEVKIVVKSYSPMNPQQSISVDVFRRDQADQNWIYCSNRPHPDWLAMSVDDYLKSGQSEMLQAVSHAEILALTNMIGQPMEELAKIRLQQEDESNQTALDESPDSSPLPAP